MLFYYLAFLLSTHQPFSLTLGVTSPIHRVSPKDFSLEKESNTKKEALIAGSRSPLFRKMNGLAKKSKAAPSWGTTG